MKLKKDNDFKGFVWLLAVCMTAVALISACGAEPGTARQTSAVTEQQVQTPSASEESKESENVSNESAASNDAADAPEIKGLVFTEKMTKDYAEQFDVYKYEDGYAVFSIKDEGQFLLVPDGKEVPEGLSEDVTVIKQPKHIYLAATALMALFTSMDSLDVVTMTSLQESGWTFDEPKKALKAGTMKYAGKYSEPDYEMLLDEGCDLAIESTMIYHTPEVQEMIEDLGIPVLVDRSSYETNPLGRAEWIRMYGVMTGHEAEADAFFAEQKKMIEGLDEFENTELQVAYFYISTDGKAIVRSSTDYIATMIDMAGGRYIFKDVTDEEGKSSIPMTIESFYDIAENADIIIYNSSIDSSVKTMEDLINKDPVMKNMKAVKEKKCWMTGSSMYQRTDIAGNMILDFHNLFTGNTDELKFLTQLK